MVSEELMMLERVGIGGTAFYLVYILLKHTQNRAFQQADAVLELARTTIQLNTESFAKNTEALNKMQECLIQHMQQKDKIFDILKECRKERNDKLKEILSTFK